MPKARVLAGHMAVICITGFETVAAQQYSWTRKALAASPVARVDHAMAYDAARRQTILFGGYNGAYLGDMWAYDGTSWKQLTPGKLPPARSQHCMAYDPIRERVVLIGGTDATPFTDIWEWDGKTWIEAVTGVRVLLPKGSAAYDPALGGVLYNLESTNLLWDGKAATSLAVSKPLGGRSHVLAYDPTSMAVMTFYGGYVKRFRPATGWENVLHVQSFGRERYAMAMDPSKGRAVLFGGSGFLGGSSSNAMWDTQLWLGSSWTRLPIDMQGQTVGSAMVFDVTRRVFVHFSGGKYNSGYYWDDTWELSELELPRATYGTFGAGCSGSSTYKPDLAADSLLGDRPILGGRLTLRLNSLPPSQPVVGWLGFSKSSWSNFPLPLDLTAFAMPGCYLLVAPELALVLGLSSMDGRAWWSLPIPDERSLAGVGIFQQVMVVSPGANPQGLLWSNAGEGRLGAR